MNKTIKTPTKQLRRWWQKPKWYIPVAIAVVGIAITVVFGLIGINPIQIKDSRNFIATNNQNGDNFLFQPIVGIPDPKVSFEPLSGPTPVNGIRVAVGQEPLGFFDEGTGEYESFNELDGTEGIIVEEATVYESKFTVNIDTEVPVPAFVVRVDGETVFNTRINKNCQIPCTYTNADGLNTASTQDARGLYTVTVRALSLEDELVVSYELL